VGSVLCNTEVDDTVVVTKGDLVVDTEVKGARVEFWANGGEISVELVDETMGGIELAAFVVDTAVNVGAADEVDTVVELVGPAEEDNVVDETVDETLDKVPGDDDVLD